MNTRINTVPSGARPAYFSLEKLQGQYQVVFAQIVAFRDSLSPTFRCSVTLDATAPHLSVRNFRQWDAWGNGFTIDDLRGQQSPQTGSDLTN